LTGFDGEDGAALVTRRAVYLITDGRFEELAARTAGWARAVIRTGPIGPEIARIMRRHRIQRLGFQPEHLTVEAFGSLRKAVKPARLVAAPGIAAELRLTKDSTEVTTIRRAVRVAEEAFKAVTARIRLGMTERELAADLEHEMIVRGASKASFPIIVAEGANSSLPHATPGNRRFRDGSAVLIDWGATVGHYRSDLTRVVFVNRIPPRFRDMYAHVLEAQEKAVRAVRPGARMGDVDAVARDSLSQAGLGDRFAHGLGHGIGLDIHEAPRLGRGVTDRLEPGMVVTVEPGVYFPGLGGVRIEDDVLVTERGRRVLSRLSRDIEAMVVRAVK
jgi:Xaa-Pro aminopeptidase